MGNSWSRSASAFGDAVAGSIGPYPTTYQYVRASVTSSGYMVP